MKGNEDDKYDINAANLLDAMVEDKVKFQSSFSSGESSMDTFLNRANPLNRIAHPALPNVVKEQLEINQKRGKN